ncbi:OmpA family protein [Ideonella sp. A 288]|uniref:OmpA family protein n=1 Tax=Ideonella sp. A 288 TaxID=1962181 RepID=UPI0018FE70FF|nr:OmpA family protein [Ideonella sp. A 288]
MAPLPILPFDEALLSAANNLLGKAPAPAGGSRHALLVDPLIDGVTGMQSQATQTMGTKLAELIRSRYTQYDLQAFNSPNLARSPWVLIGTFTGVNAERKTEGQREAYRICLALADLKTGKLVSKGLAFASKDGIDLTPTPFFRDAPAWAEDSATTGYVRTCQGTRPGDPIHPAYLERIQGAATISEAIDAYAAGHYAEALKLYSAVAETPSGQQLRVYSGLYLTNWRLGKREAAAKAFGQIVDQGLQTKRLGVKFLFRPGSTAFWSDPKGPAQPYAVWMRELSTRAAALQTCLEVVGHASASGPEPLNERLSLRRAEQVRTELLRNAKPLTNRVVASGAGSRETLIGNGQDDLSDALDRRVEFKVIGC